MVLVVFLVEYTSVTRDKEMLKEFVPDWLDFRSLSTKEEFRKVGR